MLFSVDVLVVHDVINRSAQTEAISPRECSTNSNKRRVSLWIFLHQIEMCQDAKIRRSGDMMRLVNKNQLEPGRIILVQTLPRCDTLYARNSNISGATRVLPGHLDLHAFVGVKPTDMSSRLFYELTAVRENKGLGRIFCRRWNAFDEMAKNDSLAAAGGEREAQAAAILGEVSKDGVDSFLLVRSQLNFWLFMFL